MDLGHLYRICCFLIGPIELKSLQSNQGTILNEFCPISVKNENLSNGKYDSLPQIETMRAHPICVGWSIFSLTQTPTVTKYNNEPIICISPLFMLILNLPGKIFP